MTMEFITIDDLEEIWWDEGDDECAEGIPQEVFKMIKEERDVQQDME